ncbi:MAG: hypothetical protein RL567_1742, partial [Bacteroidota bacterium]
MAITQFENIAHNLIWVDVTA